MANKMVVGLPVMLQYEGEIEAFLKAKERIEGLGEKRDFPLDVNVFLFYNDRALSPENRDRQIRNQNRYHLPIVHSQTPIMNHNSLSYDDAESERFGGKQGFLETAIEQTAELVSLSSNKGYPVKVDTHIGISVLPDLKEENPEPGNYSVGYFCEHRQELLEKSRNRFRELDAKAKAKGLAMVLENAFPAVYHGRAYPRDSVGLVYLPLNQLGYLKHVSDGKLNLDISHWGAATDVINKLEENGFDRELDILFHIEQVSSRGEYFGKILPFTSYLNFVKTLHLSNSTGIGSRLSPELRGKWGDDGTVEGIVSQENMIYLMEFARDNKIPAMIEVDYDIKNIPTNHFIEADTFLKYAFPEK